MAPRNPRNNDENDDILNNMGVGSDDDREQNDFDGSNDDNEVDDIDDSDDNDDNNVNDKAKKGKSSNDDDADDADDADDDVTDDVKAKKSKDADEDDKEDFNYKTDRKGNYLDKNGQIAVPAGAARTAFDAIKRRLRKTEDNHIKLAQAYKNVVDGAKEILTRYKTLKATKGGHENLGLTDAEITEAAQFAAQYKLDKKAAVRRLLTKAHLEGTDLKDIGVTGPVSAEEVARHTLALQEARKPKPKTDEELAREEAEGFLKRHRDARPHLNLINEAIVRFPHMSLDEIWFQIKLAAAQGNRKTKRQLDHGNNQQRQRDDRSNFRPNGNNRNRNTPRSRGLSLDAVDPNTSFDQIANDLLKEIRSVE